MSEDETKHHDKVWCYSTNGQVMSIYSEGIARGCADRYPDTIYFFADLSEVSETTPEPEEVVSYRELPVFMPGNNRNWEQVDGRLSVSQDGAIVLNLHKEELQEELLRQWRDNILWQVSFDYRMASSTMEKINTQYQVEYHDENTINKVHLAIQKHLSLEEDPDAVTDIVFAIQNAGILFRESK